MLLDRYKSLGFSIFVSIGHDESGPRIKYRQHKLHTFTTHVKWNVC